MNSLFYVVIGSAVVALVLALVLALRIRKIAPGEDRMQKIAGYIKKGAQAFLKREYKVLVILILAVAALLCFMNLETGWRTAICFLCGACLSVLAGFVGMTVATDANVRTASEARKGLKAALKVAFSGGTVMGMCVVGFGLFGATVLYLAFGDMSIVTGFGLGASFVALFARVGGGIYTKAADVGADLVGKVEAGIPEDDPRNPAVIADNVGDNVGDVAGMGADLFESYVGAIIAALTLCAGDDTLSLFVVLTMAAGVLCSVLGSISVSLIKVKNPRVSLSCATYISGGLFVPCAFLLAHFVVGDLSLAWCVTIGLAVGIIIGMLTELYTSGDFKHVKRIAEESKTGAATNIISGLSTGMMSTVLPILFISVAMIASYAIGAANGGVEVGYLCIAVAALGMLSITGVTVAVDAYGPISDNAGGIAEMSGLPGEVREITDTLDSVGNTTAAVGKGFAIGSAALTALVLFLSYTQAVNLPTIDLTNPYVVAGLFIGGAMTFLFSALTMSSVGRAAFSMIEEVRRQFRENPGVFEGTVEPDYERCVDISTSAAIKEMILPGVIAVVVPIAVGFLLGKSALGGVIAGSLITGVLMAIMMSNAGGAWDNAKKYIESQAGGKGSEQHKAAVIGDTVGDPFKDTSGPSINILLKLISMVSLMIAPLIADLTPVFGA